MSDASGWGGDGTPGPTDPTVTLPVAGGDGGPPTEVHRPVPSDGGEPPRRNWWIAVIIVLLLAIAGLLLALLLRDDGDDDDDRAPDTTTSTEVPADESTTTSTGSSTTTSTTTSTTAPPPTTTTAPAPTTTAAPSTAPAVTSIQASDISCPDPITLSWTTTNAVSVEVAIDYVGGVFDTGPPNGSMTVPAPCGGTTQTYFVTAIASNGDRITDQLELTGE